MVHMPAFKSCTVIDEWMEQVHASVVGLIQYITFRKLQLREQSRVVYKSIGCSVVQAFTCKRYFKC